MAGAELVTDPTILKAWDMVCEQDLKERTIEDKSGIEEKLALVYKTMFFGIAKGEDMSVVLDAFAIYTGTMSGFVQANLKEACFNRIINSKEFKKLIDSLSNQLNVGGTNHGEQEEG